MFRKFASFAAIALVFAVVVAGCSDDDENNGTGIATLLKAVAVDTAPSINGTVDAVWNEATAFTITAGENSDFNDAFGEVDMTLKAVTHGQSLYILAQWQDPSNTQNDRRKEWTYDNGTWATSAVHGNEDRCFLMFDAGDNGSEGANCQSMCHQPAAGKMGTTGGGHVDVWHWKATRTNPAGFADDKWWDVNGRGSDASTLSAYSDNVDGDLPMYMHTDGPSHTEAALFDADKVAFNAGASWENGNTIPYYISNPNATGSRWDVQASGRYVNGTWTVEFCRSLNTGNGDDVQLGSTTVQMTAAITDNSGGNHSGTEPFDLEF